MKAHHITSMPDFMPFSVNIKFETQAEVEKLYAILTVAAIGNALNFETEMIKIREAISDGAGSSIEYGDCFDRLLTEFKSM